MGPVIDKTKEVDEIPKILCQMDHHIGDLLNFFLRNDHRIYIFLVLLKSLCKCGTMVEQWPISGKWQ
jgi:hypothetical protein